MLTMCCAGARFRSLSRWNTSDATWSSNRCQRKGSSNCRRERTHRTSCATESLADYILGGKGSRGGLASTSSASLVSVYVTMERVHLSKRPHLRLSFHFVLLHTLRIERVLQNEQGRPSLSVRHSITLACWLAGSLSALLSL